VSDFKRCVDATHGDFYEAAGSPTIDAGVDDAPNGMADFDGDPRTAGVRTDIGPDELVAPGVPTPTPRPSPATLDHFSGYGVKASKGHPAFVPIGPLTLADRFTTRNYDLSKPTALLLPANENGKGVHDEVTHLLSYNVKASKGQAKFLVPPDVHVLNHPAPRHLRRQSARDAPGRQHEGARALHSVGRGMNPPGAVARKLANDPRTR
jgi:hypothetical protein